MSLIWHYNFYCCLNVLTMQVSLSLWCILCPFKACDVLISYSTIFKLILQWYAKNVNGQQINIFSWLKQTSFALQYHSFICVELAKNAVWIPSQGDKHYWLERNIIFTVLSSCQLVRSCQITQIFSSLTCAPYTSAIFAPIFVVLQPNLQEMLTIAQRTCTLHFVFLSASLALLAFCQVGIIEIIYANLLIFQGILEEKIVFRKIKWDEMIVFGSLIYYYLVYVNIN